MYNIYVKSNILSCKNILLIDIINNEELVVKVKAKQGDRIHNYY